MTIEDMTAIYEMAKAIYNKEECLDIGAKKLYNTNGININSFKDYYRALQKMLDGKTHSRSISTDLRNYYLSRIYIDFGSEKLRIALTAYMEAILYYEKCHNCVRKIEREIYEKHSNCLKESIFTSNTIGNKINEYWEGELGQITLSTHERNLEARKQCIQSKGIKCTVCGFDFEKIYGELGKGFIHIHHASPISSKSGPYNINIENDLFPVCPNCHAMLHRRKGSTLSIEDLKQILQNPECNNRPSEDI